MSLFLRETISRDAFFRVVGIPNSRLSLSVPPTFPPIRFFVPNNVDYPLLSNNIITQCLIIVTSENNIILEGQKKEKGQWKGGHSGRN